MATDSSTSNAVDHPDLLRSVFGTLAKALQSATHLQVVTVLGDASVRCDDGLNQLTVDLPPPADGQPAYRVMATNIDLALGDIAQTLSPQLIDGTHDAVVQLHKDMVGLSQKIVADNLAMLKDLAKELRAMSGGTGG